MKNIIKIITLSLFTVLSFSVVADDQFDQISLYTKEEYVGQPIENIAEILERFERETPEKNITFYIHGRGRDLNETWSLLKDMELNYGTRVIMFHWPSWLSLLKRPVESAKKSADELSIVFNLIKQYKDDHPEVFEKKKISLLVHSMGHIILREHAEKFNLHNLNSLDGTPLFDNLISAGADIGMTDHRKWLSSIDYVKRKFILMNSKDLMLLLSYALDLKDRKPYYYKLGLGLERMPIKKRKKLEMIDSQSTYIDLSKILGSDHRYFESTKPLMVKIFKPLVNGETFPPNNLGTKVSNEQNIYYVKD